MTEVEAMLAFLSERLDECPEAAAREVETLRRLMAAVYGTLQVTHVLGEEARAAVTALAVNLLHAILVPYTDHPDYDSAWAL